jgi:dihydropteroate synthase
MGIINVTPDSFSHDGLDGDLAAAAEQGRRFVAAGADMLDVGGESTRPGAAPVDEATEMARVVPVVAALAAQVAVPISVDTSKAAVARAALAAGATVVNDVSRLAGDPAMAAVVAAAGAGLVLMHNSRGHIYVEFFAEVLASLREGAAEAERAGIPHEAIVLDPGIGFGTTPAQSLELIDRLGEIRALGYPVLLATSRKSFLGAITGRPVEQRAMATAATVAVGIARGADIVRIHDVEALIDVCRVADAIVRRAPGPP